MTRNARLFGALWLVACGAPPSSPPPTSHVAAPVVGPVVATVDGDPIALSEVEEAARVSGLTPLAALHRLEQERALLHRAERAELGADAEADGAMRRAAVQALLRAQVEEPVGEASVADAEVAARYAANRSAWARPERRVSLHVLAAPHDASATPAAIRFIEAAIRRLSTAADPAAEANAIRAEAQGRTFDVTVETLPPVQRHGSLEEPYLAALFGPSAPGVVPTPVRTSFGVHAIVLTSIAPPFEVPLAEAAPILRRQLVAEHRAAALDALTDALREHTPVAIDERRAADVFRADLDVQETP